MSSTGVKRVILARHGRTAFNADGRLRGLSDPPLDEVGLAQVRRLAAAIAPQHPLAIMSSPLQRAVATAQAISDATGVPATVDYRLNDRDYGPHTGAERVDVEREFGSVDAAPGVESRAALTERAHRGFLEIVNELDAELIVLVSHDAFNSALLAALDPSLTDLTQDTACWNELSRVDGPEGWRVDAVNLHAPE